MRRQMLGFVGAAVAVMLTVTPGALARAGDRTVVETYPVATALCARAHAGTLPPELAPSSPQVLALCDTLENAFAPLVSTVDAAEAQFLTTIANDRAAVGKACAKPVSDHAACLAARVARRAADDAALATRRSAVLAFRTAIEANRTTFWTGISALR
jgi:hypothetical protein